MQCSHSARPTHREVYIIVEELLFCSPLEKNLRMGELFAHWICGGMKNIHLYFRHFKSP